MFKNKKRLFASIVATSLFLNNTGIITYAEGDEQTVVAEAEVETAEVEVSEAEEKETEVVVEEPKEEVVEEKAEEVEEITESEDESSEEMIPESQEEETEETVEEITDEDEIAEEEPEVDEETEVQEVVEEEVRVKKVYEYSDAKISVKATLQYAEAIPDDAEFVVTPITNQKAINAYFAALNKADNGIEYSEDNTVLYDVAFLVDKLDGNGKVEYEPEKGAVTLEVKFKKSQLTDDLGAKNAKDVVVNHLPLTDAAKESVDKAIDATNITAKDVIVEPVDATVKLVKGGTDTATVTLDSLSVVAISNGINAEKIDLNLDLLFNNRGAYGYGIIANDYSHGGDTESNMMVGKYYSNSTDTGNSSNYANVGGDFYVGEFASNGTAFTSGLRFHLAPTNVFLGDKAYAQYQANNSLIDASHLASYTKIIHKQIDVASVVKGIGSDVNKAVSNNGATTLTSNTGVTIDLTKLAAGTYIINTTDGNFTDSNGGFNVKLNNDQRLIVNCSATSANLERWNLNDKQPSSYIGNGTVDDYWLESVVFNLPNATSVTMTESMGVIIAPKAFVKTGGGACGGVLVCAKTEGSNEWHYHNHHLPEPTKATVTLGVKKEYDGNWSNKKFEFKLEKLTGDDTPCVIDAPQTIYADEDNNNPNFNKFTFGAYADSKDHEYTFKVSEVPGKEAINYDETVYFVKIVAKTENNSTSTTVTYATDSNFTNRVSEMKFTNTDKPQTTERSVKKDWNDNKNQDGKRPTELKVKLLADGVVKTTVTLNDGNGWEAKVENLPVYNGNKLIKYTWDEETVSNYTPEDPKEEGLVTTLTNTHTPEKTEAKVVKVWNDEKNYDNNRPASITVQMQADGKDSGKSVVLNDGNNWTVTVTGLPKYANGKEIKYTWVEDENGLPEGYTLTSNETKGTVTTITNSYTPKTYAEVLKKWNDGNNQDNKRPATLAVTLLADGNVKQTVTLDADHNWTAKVEDLPVFNNGEEIEYAWVEDTNGLPAGYSLESSNKVGTLTTITNKYTPETTYAEVHKVWKDANNQDGKRPASITVQMQADGQNSGEPVVLNDGNNWTVTVTGLPKNANGTEIKYTWTEDTTGLPQGYTLTSNETVGEVTTITNSYTPKTTEAEVIKVWDDEKNQDGKRPASITVQLMADKVAYGNPVVLNDGNNWTTKIENLPAYANGELIDYTWVEDENGLPEGYKLNGTSKSGTVTTITNAYKPKATEAEVIKVWDDEKNQDGKRPSSITVQLMADKVAYGNPVVLNDGNNWTTKIENLPAYANGELIDYTWVEDTTGLPTGYSLKSNSTVGTVTTITNSYTPEETELTIIKVWDDANDQDGKRPEKLDVKLMAGNDVAATVTLNDNNQWTATVKNLPVYAAGEEIKYTWDEGTLPEGYTLSTGVDTTGKITTLTNSHTPEETERSVKKEWDDAANQDGKRPAELKVDLLADGNVKQTVTLNDKNQWTATVDKLPVYAAGEKIKYEWSEPQINYYDLTDTVVADTLTTLTNTHTPEETDLTVVKSWNDNENQDGYRPGSLDVDLLANDEVYTTVTLNDANDWTATVKKLPVYANGALITYKWSEKNLPKSYTLTSSVSSGAITTLTNTHKADTTEATVTKVWNDNKNQDGKRPVEIKVDLLADGEKVDTVTLNDGNDWTVTVSNLPAKKAGKDITYTWSEARIADYQLTDTDVDDDTNVTTLTNTHTPEKTELTVIKDWNDEQNQDGKRPLEIKVDLLADGEKIDTVTLNGANKWTATVTDLDVYAAGKAIKYTWSEGQIEGYSLTNTATTTDGKVTTLTNTHTPETTERSVKKVWDDADNQDGKRPAELKVDLLADGKVINTVTLNKDNDWTATVKNLPVYAAGEVGKPITYTWSEAVIKGYDLTNTATTTDGKVTTLTNTHTPETTEISGGKTWDDSDNQDGLRPKSITVKLLADGEVVATKDVTAREKWNWKFEGMPKYKNGKEIKYELAEIDVPGYKAKVEGYNIVNTHKAATTEKAVRKIWDDNNNQDGKRPTELKVVLKANGVIEREVTLNESNFWSAVIENLPVNRAGVKIVYTWEEDKAGLPEGYNLTNSETDVEEFITTLTNSYKPEEVDILGTKTWNDDDNKAGFRPDYIMINLFADDAKIDSKKVTANDNWSWSWTNLPKYAAGKVIKYTITEDKVEHYATEISGYDVINTPTSVKVSKVDITDQKEIEGAHIKVVDKFGKVVDEWDSKKEIHIITDLTIGDTYTLIETVAPEGYTIAAETTFYINAGGRVMSSGTVTTDGVVLVEDTKTSVKISKVDVTDQQELEGAHIQIIDSKGTIVEEWDSKKEVHVVEGLKTNETYTLKETVAPIGYTITTDTTFVIDEQGNVTTTGTITEGGVILVEDAMTEVEVSKVDIVGGEELEGAHIQIIDKEGVVVKEWDSTKTPEMIRGLHTNETYTLKETVAPEGYTIATETTFIIDEKGNVTTTGTKSDEGVLLIEDAKTNVKVSKVDITDQHELEGAHIQVIDSKGVVVEEWDSTKVVHVIEGLKTNETYTLKETVAPLGYTIATENTFIIDEKGNVTTTATMTEGGVILVEDTLTEVKVSKVDIADGKELPGAKIQIINKAGEVVEEWISTTRIHVVKGLHTNEEYTLHEEVAPEGYIVATDTTFIIDENGKVTTTGTITEGGVLLIEDSMTHVEVNKIDDSPSHRLIGGAHLVLRDSKGNIVASWITEAGKAFDLIGLLCVGETYTLVEVSAPAGYDIAAPITFTIDKTGHIQIGGNTVGKITMVDVEILNDEDDVPPSDDIHEDVNTGDNSNLMLWITMFVTSAMGGLYVIYRKREDEVNC